MEQIRDLILFIAKRLVDDPASVSIKATEGTAVVVFELGVAKSDIGKVIGKQGRMAQALRTVVNASSVKAGKRCTLEILE